MMTVSQGAFVSAEWKSGCVLQLMAAGMEGVGRSSSGRRGGGKEGREQECWRNSAKILPTREFCKAVQILQGV